VATGDADDGPCPACGGPPAPWREVPSSEPALAGRRYLLLRCVSCGTAITHANRPIDALLHDSGAYRPGDPRFYRLALPILRAFDVQRLRLLERLVTPPARLLDVGAGQGRFVAAAAGAGYDAAGIEPSQRGSTRAERMGASVTRQSIEAAEIPAGSLDAVTLWHVLEHVEQPEAAVRRIAGWLAPGGALLLGVPNLNSLQARIGGGRWYHLDVPRHRTHFTPAGVERLLRSSGLEPVFVEHVLVEHNPYGMWQTAVNLLTTHPSYLYNLLKRNARLDGRDLAITALALPLVPAAAVAELLAGLARAGGTIAVGARRP
jgi:SAM-dependent methyltransferase